MVLPASYQLRFRIRNSLAGAGGHGHAGRGVHRAEGDSGPLVRGAFYGAQARPHRRLLRTQHRPHEGESAGCMGIEDVKTAKRTFCICSAELEPDLSPCSDPESIPWRKKLPGRLGMGLDKTATYTCCCRSADLKPDPLSELQYMSGLSSPTAGDAQPHFVQKEHVVIAIPGIDPLKASDRFAALHGRCLRACMHESLAKLNATYSATPTTCTARSGTSNVCRCTLLCTLTSISMVRAISRAASHDDDRFAALLCRSDGRQLRWCSAGLQQYLPSHASASAAASAAQGSSPASRLGISDLCTARVPL